MAESNVGKEESIKPKGEPEPKHLTRRHLLKGGGATVLATIIGGTSLGVLAEKLTAPPKRKGEDF